jgi:predicted transcriptional regulator
MTMTDAEVLELRLEIAERAARELHEAFTNLAKAADQLLMACEKGIEHKLQVEHLRTLLKVGVPDADRLIAPLKRVVS